MTTTKKILSVVIFSYSCAFIINAQELSPQYHYFYYACLSFTLLCVCANDSCRGMIAYAALNYVMLCLYVPLILSDYGLIFFLLYDSVVNFSLIYDFCELLLLMFGVLSGLLAILDWRFNGDRWPFGFSKSA